MFSVRIVTASHYLAQPIRDLDVAYSDFRGSEVKQVPVLRIFGATPVGQKTCLHIHGVFPYIYIRCGPLEFTADKDLRQFATSLDLALQVAMGKASGTTHHVFKVVGVQAVPMYGYHSRSHRFLKVYFYNPLMVKRAVELLQSGAVMNKVFQPHEAHIPFILQFFIDYNLYGMNLIHLAAVKFRRQKQENDVESENSSPDTQPVNLSSMLTGSAISSHRWNRDNIPSGLLLDAEIQKQSVCELEVDAVAIDILNRHELQGNTEMNPGLLAIYNEERERREVRGQLDDLHPPSSPDRGRIEDTDSELNGKARLAEIIQKQLRELRELAGGGDDDEDDDDSVLQDTLAEPSLTASQLILHDSQFTGDDESMATHEEDSQPVVNEELVQSLVEASQRSSQYSQQTAGEDQDLAQLLVDLAQDESSPEDGSLLGSQATQDVKRKQEDHDEMDDDDVRESLEMSQVWPGGSDDEDTVEPSHTTHDVSASEEDNQESQATIPQVDGGSDDKPAPIRKKSLGLKRQLPNYIPNPVGDSSTAPFNPFPPEIKTYANKKVSVKTPERPKEHPSLLAFQSLKKQSAVSQQDRNANGEPAVRAKVTTFSASVSLHKIPLDPNKLEVAVQPSSILKSKPGDVSSGHAKDKGSLKGNSSEVETLGKSSPRKYRSKGQDKPALKRYQTGTVAWGDSSPKMETTKMLSQEPSSLKKVSSKAFHREKTLMKRHSSELAHGESSVKKVTQGFVSGKASRSSDPTSATGYVSPHQTDPSTPALIKVPSTANIVHLGGCPELRDFTSLDELKKDPSWNPCLMLIKCPINTDWKGKKISCSGTSLPRQQLERIKRDNMKALPIRRSSFARKIVPPRKFMDEQFWMDHILKLSKKKNEEIISVNDTSPQKRGRPRKQKLEMQGPLREAEKPKKQATCSEPPCLLSAGHLNAVKDEQLMPVLEKMPSPADTPQQPEKKVVFTKTKALLQEKYHKSLLSSDKKNKLNRSVSFKKLPSKKDAKRYKMLSRTFNKLSLTAQESSEGGASVGAAQPLLSSSLSSIQTNHNFVSSISTTSRSSNSSRKNDSQSEASTSLADNVFLPHGQSSTAPSSSQEISSQIKKRSVGPKKRRGSDSSDDWASQVSPSHRRKTSSESQAEEFLFGKSYRFRKRERISYDEGDFPDVGFDIMCWSDQEDSEGSIPQEVHKQRPMHRVELNSEPLLESHQDPVETADKCGPFIQAREQTQEVCHELSPSPVRKRGRPPGSKNKSKLMKSSYSKVAAATGSPSKSKPHLSFTVDSLLPNGEKRSLTGACKPITVITTSHSSCCGPSVSRPTPTQTRIGQPIVTCSKLPVSISEWHRLSIRSSPVQTPVNGHHSSIHDDSNEPVLYRDAMWNLGYFSPRSKEKEGSPPRCWSPSNEIETSYQATEYHTDLKQNHKPSRHQEQGDKSKMSEMRQGHRKKKKLDDHTFSNNRDGKSHNGNMWEGNRTKHRQLMPNFNSRLSARAPQIKHKCNTDSFNQSGLTKPKTLSKLTEQQGNETTPDKQTEEAEREEQSNEVVSRENGQSKPCSGIAMEDCPLENTAHHSHLDEVAPDSEIERIPVDKDTYGGTAEELIRSLLVKSTSDETTDTTNSSILESEVITLENFEPEDRGGFSDGKITWANDPKQMEASYSEEDSQECSNQNAAPRDDDLGSGLEAQPQIQSTVDDSTDALMSSSSIRSQSSAQRVNGVPLTEDNTKGLTSGNTGESLMASPNPDKEEEPSPSSPLDLSSKLLVDVCPSDTEDQGNQKKHAGTTRAGTPPYSDDQISDCDINFSPVGSDAGSKSGSASHIKLQQDEKPDDVRASPFDPDGGHWSSSDDITPGQRRCQSPCEEEVEEDKDDICNISHASNSTVASLSLDLSLIISNVPAISPTRDVTGLEGSSLSHKQSQNHLLSLESLQQSGLKTDDVNEFNERFPSSPKSPEVLDLTMETQRCRSQNNQESTGEGNTTSSVTSRKHRASSSGSTSDEMDWSLGSKSTGSDRSSLLAQKKERVKHGSSSSNAADDSDTFSQLVCPETPSPVSPDDKGSRPSNDSEPCNRHSQQKPDSQTKAATTYLSMKTKTDFADGKTQRPNGTETNCQLNPESATEMESSSTSNRSSYLYHRDEANPDRMMESMENSLCQEESHSQDETRQSNQGITSLAKSHHRGESQSPIVSPEESDASIIEKSEKSVSLDESALTSEQDTSPSPSLDHDERQRVSQDHTIAPSNQAPTIPVSGIQATEVTLEQDSKSPAESMSASPSVTDSSQVAERLHELGQPSHLSQSHPGQGDIDDREEGRTQTSHICGSPTSPVQAPTPPASRQAPTHPAESSHLTASDVETPSSAETVKVWMPEQHPPSPEAVRATLEEFGLPHLRHQRAFCSNPDDAHKPSKPGVHDDGRLQDNVPSHLPEAESRLSQTGLGQWQANLRALKPHPLLSPSNVVAPEPGLRAALVGDGDAVITPCLSPPSVTQVQGWLDKKTASEGQDKDRDEDKTAKPDEDDKPKEKDMFINLAGKLSKPESGDASEGGTTTPSVSEHKDVPVLRTGQQLPTKLSDSQLKTPRAPGPRWKMNSTPSSPQGSALNPASWNENSTQQTQADTPRVNPLDKRGSSGQPQHSTPMRLTGQAEDAGIPVTPISGWKRPTEPSSLGGFRDREPSSSSMRQTLLFTPIESLGDRRRDRDTSQIDGATPNNTCGFRMPQLNMQDAKTMHEVQHLTVISLELHVKTRRDYRPDPDFDPIRAVFYSIQHETPPQPDSSNAGHSPQNDIIHGVIIVDEGNHSNAGPSTLSCPPSSLAHSGICNIHTMTVAMETNLFEKLVSIIREHDPDILVGYEVQQHSWGYLLERAAFLDVDLCSQISRLPELKKESSFSSERDAYGADHQSEINIAGRITLNLWRLMRHEVALTNYTFENVAFHVLHQRVPLFTYRKLTDWFDHRNPELYRWRVIDYYSVRVRGSLKLLHQLDLVGRTSELARVFGIEFYSVLSRGSQFRVESMMLRTAKPQNYVAMSPSVQQRSRMKAPECIPLVMEPESRFYQDPVIVLDFQSLYPSMMIAYNYCYSTCLGRLEHIANGGEYVFGCGSLSVSSSQLKKLLQSDSLHVSPNGIVFVKAGVRRGVLPTMLEQILKLRLIVKKAMKDFKDDKTLHRMLDSRQLALKLIANVTYGYTSANYSGRMPCIEVGDSVVRKSRETLERAIHMVETTKKWGARVVYGDTDSMFVLVEGVSKERAFEVGREIRDAVTADNPKPVKLKLEKVYQPCVLQSKKRYVGYSYESPDQTEPDFDAKGIETVRRDSCPAVGKILERALKTLFTTRDVSQVRQYVQKQFQKILDGQATMQDLIIAKEYRGSHTYRPGACVPSLEISRRLLAVDRRAEPRVGQRVPYVIVHGSPGLPLIQLVRTPSQVLQDPSLRLNTTYYLTRQLVPSLNRIFGLLGVDTMQWYQALPRWHRVTAHHQPGTPGKKGTISQYFASLNCVICEKVTKESLCSECKAKGQATSTALLSRVQQWQLIHQDMAKICASCCNFSEQDTNSCVSLDCPIMYKTNKLARQLGQVPYYLQLLDGL